MTTNSNVLDTFLRGLGATLFTDEEKVLQPVLDNYTASLVSDPSALNATNQSLAFPVAVEAVLPQAASVGIKDTATALKNLIDVQLPSLSAAVTAELQGTGQTVAVPPAPAAPTVAPAA